ncbi:Protein eyes shut -like protein Epidermal growth factor-like protein 10 [Channa argus]|uniref:Protein eyes shut-like protein Epidermal growth factor-like protein 10 n=1 Tax=Channa argus TaxID=215402 RepID=A0A6G1R0M2_CHAAH|nr:Protein eyes shut -like protein Epidermal growth factor-like protein 10 [Channa argus]
MGALFYLRFAFVAVHFIHCQTVCNTPTSLEWHPKPQAVQMIWTLRGNLCQSVSECWDSRGGDESSGHPFSFPQICPLQLQHEDKLLMSADETLKSYGIALLSVSEADFGSCSTNGLIKDQFLFSHNINESEPVDAKWLIPVYHYFIALHEGDTQLCKLGLRLNVSVKTQLCQGSPLLRLCSGNGICQTGPREGAYHCRCHHRYSGRFCEKFDACLDNPCENKGVCLSNGSSHPNHRTYECLCPPHFTGVNCSEVTGKENCARICENGTCVQASPTSFRCICDTEVSGPPCMKTKAPCDPNPCRNGGVCEESPKGFVCHCPERFAGLYCDSQVDTDCTSYACREERICTAEKHVSDCVCADGNVVPACRRQQNLCSPSPCLNNATCVFRGNNYFCRCLRGFSGKNCEGIIDYCKLLDINCLNEGLCFGVVGGYQCVCAPGWIGEFCQYVGDACLIKPNICLNGATCITTSQPSSPPQYTCKCSPGFTGSKCETEINECDSSPCLHNGTCSDLLGHYHCQCPTGFLGKNCEVDIDACALPNNTCPLKTLCLDLPVGLEYTCRVPCPQNLHPCVNGGQCVMIDARSYTCICKPGWTGRDCRINVNDCVRHWCQNGATCVDDIDGYRGYTGIYCEEDIDYCAGHHCSEHGVCLDQRYNFTCRCMSGFEGSLCELETNECNSFPCASGATCLDLISDYRCHCPPGFEGRTCSENVNDCWSQPCLNGGLCIDLINDYICHCPLGFKGKDCSVDIDLCSFGICGEHTLMCSETKDGQNVFCTCERGFGGSFCEVNLNECESKPCQNGGICVDGTDLYQCFCSEGFGGLNCEIKYDECVHGYCANNSTCIDLVADYECICPSGFTGYRGNDCSSSVDQCVSNPCDPEGTLLCEELANTYRCVCQHGYAGKHCKTVINHCVDGLCQHGSVCVDLSRGFKCDCLPGLTGQFCELDIDDCDKQPCGVLSICEDTLNGYNCFCAPGFIGNNCEIEVNECLSLPCRNGGSCIDELNSFSCLCPLGITGDYCEVNIDECISSPCLHNATCVDLVHGYGCVCLPGFTGTKCELDIDECASSPCKNGATCIDQPGNYFCQCVAPFKGHNCEFLPCEANNPCENGAVCVEELDQDHFPLGFRCHCRRGFTGPRCEINVDECSSSPCFRGFCYDVVDGFYCLCNPGYAGLRCEQDIDDCVNSLCSTNSICKDLHMSYECVCHSGWEGEYCQQEIDECLSQPCKNNATCTDLLNSYKCLCSPGWTGVECAEDVNECDSGPCLNGAQCHESAVPGEFSCTCPPFFTGPLCNRPYDPCDPLHNPCLHNSTCLTRSNGTAFCRCPADGALQGQRSSSLWKSELFRKWFLCVITHPTPNALQEMNELNVEMTRKEVIDLKEVGVKLTPMSAAQTHAKTRVTVWTGSIVTGSAAFALLVILDCAPSPCLNGGSCVDLIDKYACFCQDGYTGKTCENDVDICKEAAFKVSLCFNGATCLDGEGSNFTCSCPPGFMGDFCEVDVNECCSAPCHNGAICEDLNNSYVCHCRSGWSGLHCEDDINECLPQPCNQGICIQNDPGYGYTCFCRPGFVGRNCEHNYDDCLLNPCPEAFSCIDGINKVRCLPPATDVVPLVTAVKNITRGSTPRVPTPTLSPVPTAEQFTGTNHIEHASLAAQSYVIHLFTIPITISDVFSDNFANSSNVLYFGNSYLEFEGIDLSILNNITVKFQTQVAQGTILYVDQGPVNGDFFFMKLFVLDGVLKYAFCCNEEEDVTLINTSIRVDDGKVHIVNISQHLTPCEAELTLSGHEKIIQSTASNYWLGHMIQRTNSVFTGGLPQRYLLSQRAQPFHNYTGCIEIIEINKLRRFHTSDAIAGSNTGRCRCTSYATESSTSFSSLTTQSTSSDNGNATTMAAPTQTPKHPLHVPRACRAGLCLNGGTCHPPQLPGGALPSCHCPLHFTGTFCEKDTTIYIPSFDGTSYLELQPLTSILQPASAMNNLLASVTNVILYLTVKTRSTQGTILYTQEQNVGDQFLHVFLQDGSPVASLGCGGNRVLSAAAGQTINNNRWVLLTVRYNLPVGKHGGSCMIEIAADNGTAQRLEEYVSHPVSEGTFGPVFLGDISSLWEIHKGSVNGARRFAGCIRELQVNSKEVYLVVSSKVCFSMAVRFKRLCDGDLTDITLLHRQGNVCKGSWKRSENIEQPSTQTQARVEVMLRIGSASARYSTQAGCASSTLVSATPAAMVPRASRRRRLKQYVSAPMEEKVYCVTNTRKEASQDELLRNKGFCLTKLTVGAAGCLAPINITRARFSGIDEFGYTSFVAYSSIPSLNFFYDFKLKFTLTRNASAVKDNLMLFAGHKGQGNDGDDFLVLGLRNGRVVHKFNLGSGLAVIVSDRLNHQINIHTVTFGRSKKTGWLKVDGQRNKTGSSPGPLVGLGVFSQLFVGGYNEYIPELLPLGSRFRHGFQGCIFDLQFRTRRDGKFQILGQSVGHPAFGRNVGQCGVTPCDHVHCRNGGACVDSGSSVYCQCPFGWKGALCTETVSVCDVEHSPPPLCAHGSTCIPLPIGYSCQCPLGTTGLYCEKAVTISDPFFSGNQSSWMSFPPMSVRHRTVLQLQFRPLSPDGILVYTAQHLSARAGDFFCLSLSSGFVQLRYNLGDGTHILQSVERVNLHGSVWHVVKAGRTGQQGFLSLDNKEVRENVTEGMTTLDVATDIFVGGVPTLSSVARDATGGELVSFTGGLRELILNDQEIDLTETGALSGANVGDWDGTACGYKVCHNGGRCKATGSDSFTCICTPSWTGSVCNQSVSCVNNTCKHGSLCIPFNVTSYRCICPLGWGGRYCSTQISTETLKFMENSYVKYMDPRYNTRNLKYTKISFRFRTRTNDSLIMWMGKAEHEGDDYLAVGLESSHLKIAVNLGERLSLPLTLRNLTLCCNEWHNVSLYLNSTIIQVLLNSKRILSEDVDPFERYVALNYGGQLYFGGFELHRNVSVVTSGLFSKGFEGDLKNVSLFEDTKSLLFLENSEGFNVSEGNE